MQRYFTNIKNNDTFTLNSDDSYHLIKVMRQKESDEVEVIYNNSLYITQIIKKSPLVILKIIEEKKQDIIALPKITIAQGLVKEQKMDYIIQKSTELGINTIIPLQLQRSIIKVDKHDNKKVTRWQKVAKAASEQSKRYDIPTITNIMDIEDLIKQDDYTLKVICTVNQVSRTIKTVLSNITVSDKILFVIGPEGGFDLKEEELLINNGFISTSLGSRVLRTETSSSFILSTINYIFLR